MLYAFIIVLFHTPKKERDRIQKEIGGLNLPDYKTYFIDNTTDNKGYAAGINKGLQIAKKDNPDVFVFINTDISLKQLHGKDFDRAFVHLDLWGFAMEQHGKTYYYGELDRLRMSGGLSEKKPNNRYYEADFVTGPIICVKKEVVDKIGGWDERFFLFYEDVDYCTRAKKASFRVGVDTGVVYEHFELKGSDPQKKKRIATSRLRFLLKHGLLKQKLYELIRFPRTLIEERPFVTSFLTLNLSSFVNKLLNFVLFIFLVRYLNVSEYGIYTVVWAHIALLQPFLDFGTTSYGLVYLPLRSKNKLNSLFSLRVALAIIVFTSTFFLALMLGYGKDMLLYIFLTSFTLFSNAMSGSLLIYSSLRERLVLPSALSIGFNSVLIFTLVSGLIVARSLPLLFVLVFIFYNLYTLINFYFLKKELGKFNFTINLPEWTKILKKSYLFLVISLFAGLYFKLDVFLLNFLKGPADVGVYSAGYKFLEAFLFIAASYNFISTPVMSRLKKEALSNLKLKIRKDLLYLSVIGLGVAFGVFFTSPFFLTMLFKGEYINAIPVLRIVIWALPFILITSVFFNSLYVLGKAKVVMWLFILQTCLNVGLNLIYIPQYSYIASSYITIMGEVLNSLIALIFLYRTLLHENIS